MTLRLAGEDYSVIAGLDGLGWLRDIKATSSDPALKVDQNGSGSILDLLDSGTPVLRVLNGGSFAFLVGKAPTAGQYEIGRNADATNRLQYNVPTGARHEFSVNDADILHVVSDKVAVRKQLQLDFASGDPSLQFLEGSTWKYEFRYETAGNKFRLISTDVGSGADGDIFSVLDAGQGILFSGEVEIDGDLNHDGPNIGLYGASPVAQASKISDPSGGATIDAEARTAINALIEALEGIGIASAV